MQTPLLSLIEGMNSASCLEDAAATLLGSLLAEASACLRANTEYGKSGQVLRAMAHLRSGDNYRRIVALDMGAEEVRSASDEDFPADMLPSATAWRWIEEWNCPIQIDVITGRVTALGARGQTVVQEHGGAGFKASASGLRLLERNVTHLCVLPLRMPGDRKVGMVSVEVECQAAISKDFIWQECVAGFEVVLAIGGLHLSLLSARASAETAPDKHLPVVRASMTECIEMLRAFSRQEETILLGGPTGVGKSRLARWCHDKSPRRQGPFERVDLMTVPENLQLGRLFGWRRGAFTGADKDASGDLSRAQRGTLFIDEIDKLTLSAQAALLEVLEERVFRPLGDDRSIKADVRFIVGTNRSLEAEVRAGRFRQDLYFRINVLPLRVPPLDDRRDEIRHWAAHFAERHHKKNAPAGHVALSPMAAQILEQTKWPGNLRQLDNIIRRAYAMAVAEHAETAVVLAIDDRHVRRALQYEVDAQTRDLSQVLMEAAHEFIAEVERAHGTDRPLLHDHADAFSSLVLGAAAQRLGRNRAYKLLGKDAMLLNRNQHKDLKKHLTRIAELWRVLQPTATPPFQEISNQDGDERL